MTTATIQELSEDRLKAADITLVINHSGSMGESIAVPASKVAANP